MTARQLTEEDARLRQLLGPLYDPNYYRFREPGSTGMSLDPEEVAARLSRSQPKHQKDAE